MNRASEWGSESLSELWSNLQDAMNDAGSWFNDFADGLMDGLFGDGTGSSAESGGEGSSGTGRDDRSPGWFDPDGPFFNPPVSPLVFDLDGDGLDIIQLTDSHTYFDLNRNGFAEKTAWIGGDDGFLALDVNGNGKIDDISELFGSGTVDGFTMLAAYDSNADAVIDLSDAVYGSLTLWRDLDSDGLTDAGELMNLSDAGITSISLSATYRNVWNQDNWISHQAAYTQNGINGQIYDIWFANDQMHSIYRYGEVLTYSDSVQMLPNLAGYGTVADLWDVLSADEQLRIDFESFVLESKNLSAAEIYAEIETLLLRWAGVDTINSDSRGSYIDAQHLAFLEALHGQGFKTTLGNSNPWIQAGEALESYYDEIMNSLVAKVGVQLADSYYLLSSDFHGALAHPLMFLSAFNYHAQSDNVSGDLQDVTSWIATNVATADPAGLEIVTAFVEAIEILSWFEKDVSADPESTYENIAVAQLQTAGLSGHWLDIARGVFEGEVIIGTDAADNLDLTDYSKATIISGGGDDSIDGGGGSDVYVYRLGDGNDTINESFLDGSNDQLSLSEGILASQVTVTRSSSDLDDVTLTFADGGSVFLNEQFNGDTADQYGVEQIVFAEGTVWDRESLKQKLIAESQTGGNDTVNGFDDRADTIEGGLGNDTLDGLDGNDIYIYKLGDGNDTINESFLDGSNDQLSLSEGILASQVTVTRSASDLDDVTLTFADGGSVFLNEQFNGDTADQYGVEQIVFADGTAWDKESLKRKLIAEAQTAGNDTVNGFDDRADTIEGGLGNDTLDGLDGNDIYIYKLGDGNDTINESFLDGSNDQLSLSEGILASQVTVARSASDLDDVTLTFADGGSVFLNEQFNEILPSSMASR